MYVYCTSFIKAFQSQLTSAQQLVNHLTWDLTWKVRQLHVKATNCSLGHSLIKEVCVRLNTIAGALWLTFQFSLVLQLSTWTRAFLVRNYSIKNCKYCTDCYSNLWFGKQSSYNITNMWLPVLNPGAHLTALIFTCIIVHIIRAGSAWLSGTFWLLLMLPRLETDTSPRCPSSVHLWEGWFYDCTKQN